MRILIVDDHELLRRGVKELLAEAIGIVTFGEATSGEEALAALNSPWDLVILDLAMPGRGGLDTLKEMHARQPALPIVVLSAHEEEHYAIRALRGGARAYVTKQAASTELVRAAKRAVGGGNPYHNLARSPKEAAPHEALSDRELQVLRMLAIGKSVKQIGHELALSEKTISTYRTRLLVKMNLDSNAELMRYALRVGLVD